MKSIVLLSGGLDSTAALIAAAQATEPANLVALWFYYCQPAFEHEVRSAIRAADLVGARFMRCDLQSVIHGATVGLMMPRDHGSIAGRNTAFLPGRNALLLSAAATRAATLWDEPIELIIGCNADDAAGFPDCTAAFVTALNEAFRIGGLPVLITAPWLAHSKRQIVEWVRVHADQFLGLLEASWSCYRGEGSPCGKCTPCLARENAGIPQAPR